MPGKTTVAVVSQPCWARVQMVDACRGSIDKYVQFDAIVCSHDYANHELEVVAAFVIDVDGFPAPCLFLKVV
jgi:hypothetical protein